MSNVKHLPSGLTTIGREKEDENENENGAQTQTSHPPPPHPTPLTGEGIEYRVFLDHCKHRARPAEVGVAQDLDAMSESRADFADDPAQIHHLTLSRVMAAVEELPVQQRSVLSLVILEGMSHFLFFEEHMARKDSIWP